MLLLNEDGGSRANLNFFKAESEQIILMVIKKVKSAEERVLNELQATEQARIVSSLQFHPEGGLEK